MRKPAYPDTADPSPPPRSETDLDDRPLAASPAPRDLPPEETISPAVDSRPPGNATPSPDILRYRPGIAALAAFILLVCAVSCLVRWVDERFVERPPVSRVICRGPAGGVETLPQGTTVREALAGWGVDVAGIDDAALRRRVPDGCRITVEETRSGRRVVIEEMVPAERYALGLDYDINRAGPRDLALIPGIGAVSAAKVFTYRRARGDFGSVADLRRVPGLGADKARIIARYVSFGPKVGREPTPDDLASRDGGERDEASGAPGKLTAGDRPIDINRAKASDLVRIPGVGEVTARRIIDCRERNGPFRTVADLEKVEGIGKKKAEKIGGYVRF
jgi:competence protein ComEA